MITLQLQSIVHHTGKKLHLFPALATPLSCQALETTALLSVFVDLPVQNISEEWNHAVCGLCLFHLASVYKVYPC